MKHCGRALLVAGALLIARALPIEAHELLPALLSLTEGSPDVFDVVWRVPAELGRDPPMPVIPGARPLGAPVAHTDGRGVARRWAVRIPGGLAGQAVGLDGHAAFEVLVRIVYLDGSVVHGRMSLGSGYTIPPTPSAGAVARTYGALGIEHILGGFDHLLFVLGLLLLTRTARPLIATITAFTAAHSLTLGLAALGLLHVPGPPVEAVIALSIVLVAREVVVAGDQPATLAARRPWAVAFVFGLLHGLGFAGALSDVGLPPRDLPLALAAFNVGVELGQLAFVAAVGLTARALRTRVPVVPVRHVLGYGIGAVAAALVWQRVTSFWG